ncbi:MAG: TaqI-like C-terminal specificity domain-containing protein [Candidatus Methanofastidiosia archaeon]
MTYVLKITDDKASQEQVAVAILDSNNPLFERFEALSPYFSEKDWQFMPASLKKLEEKFERQSIPLSDIATVVKSMETGKNEVLAPSIEIIKQFKIEKELIHPVAKSGSIVRFHIEEDNRRIIWTEGIKFSDYPELKAYLTPYREDLSKRHDIKARKANWWEISNPRNADLFFSDYEQILVPFMATGNKFCVDTEKHLNDGGDLRGIFFNKDSEISPYYVCAILNSKAGEKYHKTHSKLKRGGYYEYYEGKLSLFPIRHISFTTPEQERKAMVEKLKELYHKEVG